MPRPNLHQQISALSESATPGLFVHCKSSAVKTEFSIACIPEQSTHWPSGFSFTVALVRSPVLKVYIRLLDEVYIRWLNGVETAIEALAKLEVLRIVVLDHQSSQTISISTNYKVRHD